MLVVYSIGPYVRIDMLFYWQVIQFDDDEKGVWLFCLSTSRDTWKELFAFLFEIVGLSYSPTWSVRGGLLCRYLSQDRTIRLLDCLIALWLMDS